MRHSWLCPAASGVGIPSLCQAVTHEYRVIPEITWSAGPSASMKIASAASETAELPALTDPLGAPGHSRQLDALFRNTVEQRQSALPLPTLTAASVTAIGRSA